MSLYDTSDWATDSEKKLITTTAFEEDSVLGDLGELDPKLELSVDLQRLIAETTSAGGSPLQLFPDLLGPDVGVHANNSAPDPFSVVGNQDGAVDVDLSCDTAQNAVVIQPEADPALAPDRQPPDHHQLVQFNLDQQAAATPSSHMPQIVHIELPSNVVGLTAVPSPAEGSHHQQNQVTTLGKTNTIDLSAAISAGATLLELPIATSPTSGIDDQTGSSEVAPEVSSSSTKEKATTSRGRGKNTLKATPPSKKRYINKESAEYKERRERNNIAVRKSRDKAKQKQLETNSRVQLLTERNEELTKKVELLTKELNVLKGLFTNIGATLPPELKKFIKREQM